MLTFLIEEKDQGRRLDAVLADLLEEFSRSHVQKLIDGGQVQVEGVPETVKKRKLKVGEQVSVTIEPPAELDVQPQNIPLNIVYEDEDLLVVDKPAGLVVHPGAGNPDGTLVNGILYHCGDSLSSINGVIRPGIVHRIDKDTSGLLMVAKNDKAHQSLAAQLETHSILRAYRAIVLHNIKEDHGRVEAPIGRDPKNRLRMAVVQNGGRHAVTNYEVLERFGAYTYIQARLETGRTHQIRVHMTHLRHPLLGDRLYGPEKNNLGANRQMLHAESLGFVHPTSGKQLEFHSPLPEDFQSVLDRLRR
ncbi:MAG: RluA family pseudouridine synthase [Clostridiales bacterium]|nr:RluA family pseudouridine synthase [Clostridiales bacterium]